MHYTILHITLHLATLQGHFPCLNSYVIVELSLSAIDDNNDGAISFDEWLAFALSKYRGQVGTLPATPMDMKKDEFLRHCTIFFPQSVFTETENLRKYIKRSVSCCKEAATPGSEGAKAMYFFHWRAFQAADADRDGKVSGEEFNLMIDFCIDTPRRWGYKAGGLGKVYADSASPCLR